MMVLREAHGALVTLADIARCAGVSSKTIGRHLHEEGLRLREAAEKVRLERASELLFAPGAPELRLCGVQTWTSDDA
jgi:AraC-like DNA-binding protein